MANIEELQRALRQGSDAKARLAGLDEQYQQAQDRGVATTKKDRYGQVSPLSVLADVVGQSRSRRDMRELAPQREAARSNIAQHENAQGLFNAVRQQEQDSQIQANWTDGHALKLAQQSQSEAREVSRQEELAAKLALESQIGKPTTVWDIETGARQDITFDPQGNPFTLTTQGLEEPFDMTGYSTTKPEKVDKNGKYGGLTPNAIQTGLKEYEKKLKPVESMVEAVARLDSALSPYAKGGAKEGQDIGGIGGIGGQRGEGVTGHIGDAWRWIDDVTTSGVGDSATISNAVAGVIAPIIRNQAGLAQTMSETKKVIDAYGLQNISNEKDFLRAYPYIKKAIEADLARIQRTTLPEVKEYYDSVDEGVPLHSRIPQELNLDSYFGGERTKHTLPPKTGDMTKEQLEAELAND